MSDNNNHTVTDNVGTGEGSKNSLGKWYELIWSFSEYHYDDRFGENYEGLLESETIFIPSGGSIAKHVLNSYNTFVSTGRVYTREERGMDGHGCWCKIYQLILLTKDGQKISGFKPKSIAHLFCSDED